MHSIDIRTRMKNETTKISREKKFGHDQHVKRNPLIYIIHLKIKILNFMNPRNIKNLKIQHLFCTTSQLFKNSKSCTSDKYEI